MNGAIRKNVSYVLLVAFTVLVLAGGLSLGVDSTQVNAANLVLNPGFESGTTSWTMSAHSSQSSTDKHSGTYSMKLAGTADSCNTYQTISVSANTNYTFSFWGKCSVGAHYKVMNSSWTSLNSGNTTANNTWTNYSLTFNSGSNTSVMICITDTGSGTSYFDDFSLDSGSTTATPTPTPLPTATPVNIILNPGFESGTTSWTMTSHSSQSSADKHSGTYSMKLAGTGDACNTHQTVNVSANTNYTFSLWGKCGAVENYRVMNSSWVNIASGNTTANNTWTKYTLTFNSGSNTSIMVAITDFNTGTSYFDDFSLTSSGSATPTPRPSTSTPTPTPRPATNTPTRASTPTPTPSGQTPMRLGTNLWNMQWHDRYNYFKTGVNWATVTDPWNPTFISECQAAKYKCFRFNDWCGNNPSSTMTNWTQRIAKTANHDTSATVAYEWQIDLCNRVGADMWVNIPHLVDVNDFCTNLATLIKNNLNSNLKVYVEWSNEVWNWGYTVTTYAQTQADALGLPNSFPLNGRTIYSTGSWRMYTVYQSCKAWKAFENVFGAGNSRVVNVLCGQLGYGTWPEFVTNFGDCSPMAASDLAALNNSTINPNHIMPNTYAMAPYWAGSTAAESRADIAAQADLVRKAKNAVSWYGPAGCKLTLYECGADNFAATDKVAVQRDPLQYNVYLEGLNSVQPYVDGIVNMYTHAGECWGAKVHVGDSDANSPKWRGMLAWISGKY